jgi:hypothetical protein
VCRNHKIVWAKWDLGFLKRFWMVKSLEKGGNAGLHDATTGVVCRDSAWLAKNAQRSFISDESFA